MPLKFAEDERVRGQDEVPVRCRACGKTFGQPRWYTLQGVRLHFCGSTCREAWEQVQTDEPFRLELRGRPKYRGGNWDVQSARARERDEYRCQMCGVSEDEMKKQLDVHHKVPARTFESPADANQLSNLISVCRSCHKKLEEEGRGDLPLFERVRHPGQRSEEE